MDMRSEERDHRRKSSQSGNYDTSIARFLWRLKDHMDMAFSKHGALKKIQVEKHMIMMIIAIAHDPPLQKNQIPLLWPRLLCYGWSDCFTLRSMLLNLGSFLKYKFCSWTTNKAKRSEEISVNIQDWDCVLSKVLSFILQLFEK